MGRSFLLVERYDRTVEAQGQQQRIHQEDFCQALSVVPEMKYQNGGGLIWPSVLTWCVG
ncbi:HipA domain-containing protein [Ampullimonas aquatilis]|uniref:HipA domain-containing protein n=1 Tax=Ampullimonas aquatilis TaxID=1341549 RepID=UPI003C769EFC